MPRTRWAPMMAAFSLVASAATAGPVAKNWTPPAYPIRAQALSDRLMASHPELLSVTFHGVPPGMSGVYTMFAGSYPDRIGAPDDPDDIDVSVKGITILDPRWRRTKDPTPKFVVLMPLRSASGDNLGLLVLAFKTTAGITGEAAYARRAIEIRDALEADIPDYGSLFAPQQGAR